LRVGVANRGIDLRRGQIAPRAKLGRFELRDHLAFAKTVAFLRENFLDAPGHARTNMRFVHLNRAGDGVPSISARRKKDRQSKRQERAKHTADLISCEQFPR
jgi:hypothetical protein